MFVITLKSKLKNKKAKLVLCVAVVILCLSLVFACASVVLKSQAYCESVGEYSTVAENLEQVKGFASQFYTVGELYSTQEIYIPEEFNEVYKQYNELQKKQGLDLEPYKGKKCTLYVYEVLDFESDYKMFMSVIVYSKRVIGGDISPQLEDGGCYTLYGEKVM